MARCVSCGSAEAVQDNFCMNCWLTYHNPSYSCACGRACGGTGKVKIEGNNCPLCNALLQQESKVVA